MTEFVKIGIVFVITLFLTFKRVALWISLLVGTFLLGILFHLSLQTILLDLLNATLDQRTLLLVGALFVVLLFSNLLKETGRMNAILQGFRSVFRDLRIVIAVIPAIIGFMPIVGGALVSAPMVVEASDELKLSPERRTFINYWFRHLWEYILPYPAFMLAITMLGLSVRTFAWFNFPLSLAAIFSGIFVGFWGISKSHEGEGPSNTSSGWTLFLNLFPLVVALTLALAFKVELFYAFGLTILAMIILYRVESRLVFQAFRSSLSPDFFLTVFAVMGFKKVLESSNAIPAISTFLSSSGIPFWLIAILIPFAVGVISGMTVAPIGISFPILIPLFQKDPNFQGYMVLAFASGIGGDLLSPFHLCLVLTKDYFRADLKGVYRLLWFPVACILFVGMLMTFFLHR